MTAILKAEWKRWLAWRRLDQRNGVRDATWTRR